MILSPDLALLDSAAKDALIRTLIERLNDLTVRLEVLEAENAALRKENAELRVNLDLPPKTPDNSSTPPSQGHKASGGGRREAEGQAACWGASSVASEPDPASRCCGEPMPALPGGCLRRHADASSHLRPHRDSRDQTRPDTGRIARRHVPMLRQAVQSRAAGGAFNRLARWARTA